MTRVRAFDWLRGLAVLVMIQTHSLGLLKPETHTDPLFRWLIRIDGLVAPAFIFCAGFALALVQCRAALAGQRRPQAVKSLKRILEVLAVASFVNAVWFPVFWHPSWFLRLDILHCIGLSLLLALPLLVALSQRPLVLRWVLLGLAAAVFAVSPLFEQATGFFGLLVNPSPGFFPDPALGSTFPLLPWAGYVFLGASTGATIAAMTSERQLWLWLWLIAGLGAALWANQDALNRAYPPHSFWVTNPANAAQRWTLVVALIALFRLVELKVASPPVKWLAVFSASSMSAYVFHEFLLFERHVGVFTRFFKEQADWPFYAVLLLALIFATWGCMQLFEALQLRAKRMVAIERR